MNDKIVSFEDYRKRKLGDNYKRDALSVVFEMDLREQPEMIAWHQFHTIFNKYKLFVHTLFNENMNIDKNLDSGFVIVFNEEQIIKAEDGIRNAVDWWGKKPFVLKAKEKTLIQLCQQLTGETYRTNFEAMRSFKQILLHSDNVIIISELSKLKSNGKKEHIARHLIKTLDDAHFEGIKPESQLIFIDFATFFQKAWKDIGSYLKIITAN